MKVYLAALLYNDFREGGRTWTRLDDREKQAVIEAKWVLDSYHYVGNDRMIKRMRETGKPVFLDSGAFSAFTQGVYVDINKYIRYCRNNADLFEIVSVLDAIGDADQTYHNLRRMEAEDIYALPCYHYGEDEAVLDYYASNYPYITLGGMVPISTPQLRIWLDRIWSRHLVNGDGTPKTKVHGFGLTSVPLMNRYPWYSVDSSSWVQLGGMGNIFLPDFGTIAVSEHAPQRKEKEKHIDSLTAEHREVIVRYIENLGFDLERLRTGHLSRKCLNIVTYSMMGEIQEANKTFSAPQPHLF